MFATDKGLTSRFYTQLKKLNIKTNNPVKKQAKNKNRQFSKGEMQMAHRHTKKCSGSLTITEMQIKNHFLTSLQLELFSSKNQKALNEAEDIVGGRVLIQCWWEYKLA